MKNVSLPTRKRGGNGSREEEAKKDLHRCSSKDRMRLKDYIGKVNRKGRLIPLRQRRQRKAKL